MDDNETDRPAYPVIVFDGHCVLCSANARFVLRNDRSGHFRLAAMQGEVGADLLRRFGIDPDDPDTLIVVQGGAALRNSDAVLAIWSGLGWPWRICATLRIVPRQLRDTLYRFVARNRFRLFGRNENCFVPDPRWSDRLL